MPAVDAGESPLAAACGLLACRKQFCRGQIGLLHAPLPSARDGIWLCANGRRDYLHVKFVDRATEKAPVMPTKTLTHPPTWIGVCDCLFEYVYVSSRVARFDAILAPPVPCFVSCLAGPCVSCVFRWWSRRHRHLIVCGALVRVPIGGCCRSLAVIRRVHCQCITLLTFGRLIVACNDSSTCQWLCRLFAVNKQRLRHHQCHAWWLEALSVDCSAYNLEYKLVSL